MAKNLSMLIEKLFITLLVGACGFMVTYLRDINTSLTHIQDKMGVACEKLSALDATVNSAMLQMSMQQQVLDNHESRLDAMSGGQHNHGG